MYVTGGGCSGFQYGFSMEEGQNEDDFEIPAGAYKRISRFIIYAILRKCSRRLQRRSYKDHVFLSAIQWHRPHAVAVVHSHHTN